jgi:uncharacterized integral membrane protein
MRSGRSRMETAKLVGTLVVIGLLIVFTLQNTESVGLDLLFWELEASAAFFVFILLALGVIVGWVLRSLREPGGLSILGISRGGDDRPDPLA